MIQFTGQFDLYCRLIDVGVEPKEAYRIASALFAGVKILQHRGSDRYDMNQSSGLRDDHPSMTAGERNK